MASRKVKVTANRYSSAPVRCRGCTKSKSGLEMNRKGMCKQCVKEEKKKKNA